MRKSKCLFVTVLLLSFFGNAQNTSKFKIKGQVKFLNNKQIVVSNPVFFTDSLYCDGNVDSTTVSVRDNHFVVGYTAKYPTPFQFSYLEQIGNKRKVIVSDLLFSDGQNMEISLNKFSESPKINFLKKSQPNTEYNFIHSLYSYLESDTISYKVNSATVIQKDSIIADYVLTHTDSYVALWILILDYTRLGYNIYQNNALKLFSENIKSSKTYQYFEAKIATEQMLQLGQVFPFRKLSFGSDIQNQIKNQKYTLIDFWASYCGPCIAEFPNLKTIYKTTSRNVFEIVLVAINSNKDERMDDLLKENQIPWKNILDNNGSESKNVNIYGIPRNFILDSNGKIVGRDLTPVEIATFLKEIK